MGLPGLRLAVLSMCLLVLGCGQRSGWHEYVSKEGGFRVTVPLSPVESKVAPSLLQPSEVTRVLVDRGAAGMLQVSYYALSGGTTMSPDTVAAALKVDCSAPYQGGAFTLEESKPHALGAIPGVSVTGRAPRSSDLADGGWEEDRCYLVGGRLFHLVGIAPDTAAGRADTTRFLDSFALRTTPGR